MTSALPKGIRTRGDSFVVDVSFQGQRKTGTAPTIEEAILLRRDLLAQIRGQPVVVLTPRQQKSWALSKAIGVAEQVAWKEAWGKRAAHNANDLAKFVGKDRPLDTIDINTLELWTADLEARGKSDATINRYLAAVSKVFSVAKRRRGAGERPDIPRRKEGRGRTRFLTREEEAAFLGLFTQWSKQDEVDLFVVLIDTGVRMGEALRLEPRDADFETGFLSVWKTKNGDPRSVPMTKRVREVIGRRTPEIGPVRDVFSVSPHSFRQTWDRAKVMFGLSDDKQLVPHALRHTCASRLVQRGVPLKVVQEWMGHKTISVTMRYAHLAPANLLAAVKVLEEED
ncbi:MAG: tyrosine-type recombinase/integrase [Actinobacteria bacterium]|nr:tyrosine-type recombinase/integrase [Actinomycetota bacterium]